MGCWDWSRWYSEDVLMKPSIHINGGGSSSGVEDDGTVTAICVQKVPLDRGMLGRSYAMWRSCSPLALPTASGLESGSKSAKRLNHGERSVVTAAASGVHKQTGA